MKPEDTRLTVEIPIELHRRAKIRAIELGKDLRTMVMEGLELAIGQKTPARARKGARR